MNRTQPGGRQSYCKPCMNELNRASTRRHRARKLAYGAAYRAANRAELAQKDKEYYLAHRQERYEYTKLYRRTRPSKYWEWDKRAKAKRKGSIVGTVTKTEWEQVLTDFNHACAYCLRRGIALTQDHIIPVSVGGPHQVANVVPACGFCNSSKHNRSLLEFLRHQITTGALSGA